MCKLTRTQILLYGFTIVLAASLPHFWTTPDGVLEDSAEYIPMWLGRPLKQWHGVLYPPYFFDLSWHYLGWKWGGYGAERVLGLGWTFCLLGALVWWSITSRQTLPVVIAVLVATRYGLWTQRHHLGMEMIFGQACLIYTLQHKHWFRAACIAAIGPWLYLCCCAWVSYPAVWLWGEWSKMFRCYVVLGILLIPFVLNLYQFPFPFNQEADKGWSWTLIRNKVTWNVLSLYDERYSSVASWLWSYIGVQKLPFLTFVLFLTGILVALWSTVGRMWIVTFCLGFVPNLISPTGGGASHRQLMILLPVAILTGMSLYLVPQRLRTGTALLAGTASAIVGVSEWMDGSFWLLWKNQAQIHAFWGFWHQKAPPLHPEYPAIGVAVVGLLILLGTYLLEERRCTLH